MAINEFNGLLRELDEILFYSKNLIDEIAGKISQVPKKITPYIEQYGPLVPFIAGAALYVSGVVHMKYDTPEDLTGLWTTLSGMLIMMGTTFATVLYEI